MLGLKSSSKSDCYSEIYIKKHYTLQNRQQQVTPSLDIIVEHNLEELEHGQAPEVGAAACLPSARGDGGGGEGGGPAAAPYIIGICVKEAGIS